MKAARNQQWKNPICRRFDAEHRLATRVARLHQRKVCSLHLLFQRVDLDDFQCVLDKAVGYKSAKFIEERGVSLVFGGIEDVKAVHRSALSV